ncbi:PAS domain-containing protein [Falsirhodobacter sp. 20TX0035]|uniref:PAS domain-containing protein n=1 Tax=Falsirhodobacter sp. 20TX0035 TaxID=3022019 RepID=UPI00232EAE04|nr:PAS domain-containing protein [Falsirhodobacter sp. 20TX0035]MDB6454915.1 PAS domain-containing protein [Falsirhodobacter sp. 20TX0035]
MTTHLPADLKTFLLGSHVALALAAPERESPLLLVNNGFSALTGYQAEEVLGQNCRFLQRDADNRQARARIHAFFDRADQNSVRTDLVNFRKDGTPFVNLLYMSKLRNRDGSVRYIFASQFDISRTRTDLLAEYDEQLGHTLTGLRPILSETGTIIDGSLLTVANSASMIAQAKMLLSTLNEAPPLA